MNGGAGSGTQSLELVDEIIKFVSVTWPWSSLYNSFYERYAKRLFLNSFLFHLLSKFCNILTVPKTEYFSAEDHRRFDADCKIPEQKSL